MNSPKSWDSTIADATKRFIAAGIEDPRTNAEHLALFVLNLWHRSELSSHLDAFLIATQEAAFQNIVSRRLAHEPLQYITGETEFFGLRLYVSGAALIPRSDTEILVEEILKESEMLPPNISILDIGTGSGAIALAFASNLPQAKVLGIDISPDAISLAQRNKKRLGLTNVSFERVDLYDHERIQEFVGKFDIIVSNPPYISLEEFQTLDDEVRLFDPRVALTDESDGFSFYHRIAEVSSLLLTQDGVIGLEVSYNGARRVEEILRGSGISSTRRVKDIQGIERVIVGRFEF